MSRLRIIYAGTPDFAVPALQALLNSSHQVVAVYTQPDRPAGRGRKVNFGPVKQLAVEHNIPVEQPETLKEETTQQHLASYKADVMVVAAYGLILPQTVLDMPTYGCLNIHGSLLPRWRGAAPIQRAIQAGDAETGNTIMQMAAGLDTGDMLHKSNCPISQTDTGQTIHDKLATQGADDLLAVLEQLVNDTLKPQQQDESQTTYAHKLSKEDARIDWTKSAAEIDRMIRGFNPWPVAFTEYHGKPMKIWMSAVKDEWVTAEAGSVINESAQGIEVATGEGILVIKRLQMPGKKAMDIKDFINGHSLSSVQLG
ncbi:MAG: methionyl-tRNA formyltransferase [Thiotrichaceae bacterium]